MGGGLALGVTRDAIVWVKTVDDTVGFRENFAALDQRLDGLDKILFVPFLLGLALDAVDVLRDHLADGAALVERVLDTNANALGDLRILLDARVLLLIPLILLGLEIRHGNIIHQGRVALDTTLLVDDVTVVINLAGALPKAAVLIHDVCHSCLPCGWSWG